MAEPEPEVQQYSEPEQQAPYQSFGNEGQQYESYENGYQYQPGQYQSYEDPNAAYQDGGYAQPAGEQPQASQDNDWINAILGIDENEEYASDAAATAAPVSASAAATTATAATGAAASRPGTARPQGQRPGGNGPAKRPVTAGSGAGNGNGKGPGRKLPKLNRNGYMFLAFVVICFILFIVLISAIVRSCRKVDGEETDPSDVSVTTEATEETTTAATVETTADPSAPIGYFHFQDEYIGYRTWWDLFHQVYGIDDIENESDPRIAVIINYNGLSADYRPSNGDMILLPPVGVLDGTIPVTFQVGATSTGETQAPEETDATEEPLETVEGDV